MIYRTFDEFFEELQKNLPECQIIFGATKGVITSDVCFITHRESNISYSDDTPFIESSDYDLLFMMENPIFNNLKVLQLTNNGVNFQGYDKESVKYVFTATVSLFGPGSVPNE